MYKSDNIILWSTFIILNIFFYFYKLLVDVDTLSIVVSFLSIYFGFLITSFSIMISSDEVKKLYLKKDEEDNSLNLLERLNNYYKFAIYASLTTIIAIIIILIFKLYNLTFILPACIYVILYPVKTIFKILFDLFTNKKVL